MRSLLFLMAAACAPASDPHSHSHPHPHPHTHERVEPATPACLDASPEDVAGLWGAQDRARANPDDVRAWVDAGMAWIETAALQGEHGAFHTAEDCAERALAVAPDDLGALELTARVQQSHHAFAEALGSVERVLEREPLHRNALALQSDLLLELGRYEEAVAAAQRLTDLDPGPEAFVRGAHLRFLHGDHPGARLLMLEALKARDRRQPAPVAWAFCEAGNLFWHIGDHAGADALFVEALDWMPGYPLALRGRARMALAAGEPKRALTFLEGRTLDGLDLWLLGDVHTALGNEAAAKAAYDRFVEEGITHDGLSVSRYLTSRSIETELAVKLATRESELRESVAVDDALAWALYRAGDLEGARAASDRALRLGTPDASYLFHAGAIRMAAGETAEGRAKIARALELNPAFDLREAAEARAMLAD